MKTTLYILFSILFINSALGENTIDTSCTTRVFANALEQNADKISAADSESTVQQWVYQTLQSENVLRSALECEEIKKSNENDTLKLLPIQFVFPDNPERKLTINYSVSPKILRQRLLLTHKTELPTNDASPAVDPDDPNATWTNTDPAWYAIMVVEHGKLDSFVGDDKNNTISLKYINDNIDDLYPHGMRCTSKTALANDNFTINKTMREKTINAEKDSNDYYVAGDRNLQWISYTEIALDVVITVATFGAGAAVTGGAKAARVARAGKNIKNNLRELSKLPQVQNYINMTKNAKKIEKNIESAKNAKNALTQLDELEKSLKTASGAKRTEILKQIDETEKIYDRELKALKTSPDKIKNTTDLDRHIDQYSKNLENTTNEIQNLVKSDKDVQKYKNNADALQDLAKYSKELHALKTPQTGNIISRAWKTIKAINNGNKTIKKSAKIARGGMKTGKIRDWLFHSTLNNLGKLGKVEQAGGLIYGTLKFAGDMYDYTSDNTDEYTNGIEFKPLLLLSADDLAGQENVVNYGMWLMWAGDSISATDDDAAYLQAIDFAEKFSQDLNEEQNESGNHNCNVDIYVVRPILRNPGNDNQELYYLIMNDIPWTTESDNDIPTNKCDGANQCNTTINNTIPMTNDSNNLIAVTSESSDNYTCDTTVAKYNQANNVTPYNQLMRSTGNCNKLSGNDKSRCINCVNHAGSYQQGRCYVEVLHYFCQTPNGNNNYSKCGLRRKNVDVENEFTCPKDEKLWAFSGCCQHGGSAGAKHPPINIYGNKNNCNLPLNTNTAWRVGGNFVTDITTGTGEGVDTGRNWYMPKPQSTPWAHDGTTSGAHCNSLKIFTAGQHINKLYDLNN